LGPLFAGSGGGAGAIAPTAATMATAALASDRRLKENIALVGNQNGYNLYEFNYIGSPERRYRFVMADEVEAKDPSAIFEIAGIKFVNTNKIGIPLKEV